MPGDGDNGPDGAGPPQTAEALSCVSCRSRKLKCDRTKPACARCKKVNNECVYPESRRKPAFKRRNVKELEARLGTNVVAPNPAIHRLPVLIHLNVAQVEDLLKGAGQGESSKGRAGDTTSPVFEDVDFEFGGADSEPAGPNSDQPQQGHPFPSASTIPTGAGPGHDASSPFQLLGLGMAEAPPPPEVIEELYVCTVQAWQMALTCSDTRCSSWCNNSSSRLFIQPAT